MASNLSLYTSANCNTYGRSSRLIMSRRTRHTPGVASESARSSRGRACKSTARTNTCTSGVDAWARLGLMEPEPSGTRAHPRVSRLAECAEHLAHWQRTPSESVGRGPRMTIDMSCWTPISDISPAALAATRRGADPGGLLPRCHRSASGCFCAPTEGKRSRRWPGGEGA